MKTAMRWAGFFILAIGLIPVLHATTITDAAFGVVLSDDSGPIGICATGEMCTTGPASAMLTFLLPPSSGPDGSAYSGSASAEVTGSTDPSVAAAVAAAAAQLEPGSTPDEPYSLTATAVLMYYFELTTTDGDPYTGPVPVLMDGSSTLATNNGNEYDFTISSVFMQVETADGMTTLYSLPSGNNGGFSQTLDILPNVMYEVTMQAQAEAQVADSEDSPESEATSASIDPTFTISPDYSNDFALTFSSGIGNEASTAPEPSTLGMALVGIAAIAGAVRRRRCRRE